MVSFQRFYSYIDSNKFGIDDSSTLIKRFNVLTGAYNVQKCPNYISAYLNTSGDQLIPMLKRIEEIYDCSGVCIKENIFMFSNINK